MTQSAKSKEKRERFGRMFPPRVHKLIKTFDVLINCTSHNYEFDQDLVHRVWIEIAKSLRTAAKAYGLELTVELNGTEVEFLDTTKPLLDQVKIN